MRLRSHGSVRVPMLIHVYCAFTGHFYLGAKQAVFDSWVCLHKISPATAKCLPMGNTKFSLVTTGYQGVSNQSLWQYRWCLASTGSRQVSRQVDVETDGKCSCISWSQALKHVVLFSTVMLKMFKIVFSQMADAASKWLQNWIKEIEI